MESDIIVGLDIGTTKIACIVGTKNEFGKINIHGYGKAESKGVTRGVVTNIENTVQSIRKAVDIASKESKTQIDYVNVGIAGQHIKSMQHRGNTIRNNSDDEITKDEIEALTQKQYKLNMAPGDEIIDVIPQDYIIDNESGITEPVGMLGNTLEANFHIIIGQTTSAKNIIKCIKKAELEMSTLILEPIASARAVLSEEEKEAGVALVDIGGGTTDLAIFQDNIIRHSCVIPYGGDIITDDIKVGCKIMKRQAEELKVKFGSALADENNENEVVSIPGLRGRAPKEITLKMLALIIQARIEEIIDQVYFEIKNSGFEEKLIAGIVLTGGGAQLNHLSQLTEFMTGMPTRIGYPDEHLADGVDAEMTRPMYATGVGLVIEGISRFNLEKEKDERKIAKPTIAKESIIQEEGELQELKIKEEKERNEKSANKFFNNLKKWFENDTAE